MTGAYQRLVRLLDDDASGGDPDALLALLPLAVRRGDVERVRQVASRLVEPPEPDWPEHALVVPDSVEALLGEDAVDGRPLAPPQLPFEDATDELWRRAETNRECDADLTRAGRRLLRAFVEARPSVPPLDTLDAEAALWRICLVPYRLTKLDVEVRLPRLLDRWVALGGLEFAVRALAAASQLGQTGPFSDATGQHVYGVRLASGPHYAGLDELAVRRLYAWFRLPDCNRPSRATVTGWLDDAEIDANECDATVELWLADDPDTAPLDALCRRLTSRATARPGTTFAMARAAAALRPGQGEHLVALLDALQPYPVAVCDYLPAIAERLGGEALEPLCDYFEHLRNAAHLELTGRAIASIPGRATIRRVAPWLAHKTRARRELAAEVCRLHPVDTVLELPRVINALAADPARKGQADRKRAIARATAILDELRETYPQLAVVLDASASLDAV